MSLDHFFCGNDVLQRRHPFLSIAAVIFLSLSWWFHYASQLLLRWSRTTTHDGRDAPAPREVIAEGHVELLCVPGHVVRQHRPRSAQAVTSKTTFRRTVLQVIFRSFFAEKSYELIFMAARSLGRACVLCIGANINCMGNVWGEFTST